MVLLLSPMPQGKKSEISTGEIDASDIEKLKKVNDQEY